jgi:hypothetical protein
MMRALDHASVPLSGMNLIEASAGTGKTHAIASLYLRLIVERGLLPDSILVVTYTEAASGELRGRIRERIRDALMALRDPRRCDEALLLIGSAAPAIGVEEADRRLQGALGSFDTAAVHTIHAFERGDWGEGGADFAWWCFDDGTAFVGDRPLFRTMETELRTMVGDAVYAELAGYLEDRAARGTTVRFLPTA